MSLPASIQAVLANAPGTPGRLAALKRFNMENAATQSFASFMTSDQKKQLVDAITSGITSMDTIPIKSAEVADSFVALRLLAREDIGLNTLITVPFLERVFDAAGLKDPSKCDLRNCDATDFQTRTEAAKLLINMLLRTSVMDLTKDFHKLGGLKNLMTLLTDLLARTREDFDWMGSPQCDAVMFPYARLWFNICRPVDENADIIQDALNEGGISLVGEWLEHLLNPRSTSGRAFPAAIPMCASDLIRVLVGLTIDMGPLGKNQKDLLIKHIPNFQTLINTLMHVLDVSSAENGPAENPEIPLRNEQLFGFALIVSSALVNIPVDFVSIILRNDVEKSCKSLYDLFSIQVFHHTSEGPKGLTPQMLLMATLAKASAKVRPILLRLLFPHRNLAAETAPPDVHTPGQQVRCVGNKIIEMMTDLDISVKYWSNELLFQLCDENPDKFVKLTGFGNAAGLLVMRNLFGMGKHLNEDTASEMRQAKAASASSAATPASASASSGSGGDAETQQTQQSSAAPKMTTKVTNYDDNEEYDDEEMERLARKLMMMEEKGLVKIIRKGDKEGEEYLRQHGMAPPPPASASASASSSSASAAAPTHHSTPMSQQIPDNSPVNHSPPEEESRHPHNSSNDKKEDDKKQ